MYYEEKKKNKDKIIIYSGIVIIIALLAIIIIKVMSIDSNPITTSVGYNAQKLNADSEIIENKPSNENMIEKSVKAIVGISKIKENGTSIFINNAEEKLGLGSGVVITDNGYIVSNQHVVGNKYSTCYVALDDGKTYEGSVVWADKNIDLAIIKINKGNLDYLNLGDSDSISLAEDIYAIGNPLGMDFQKTVTKGIISALNRTIKIEEQDGNIYMEDLIQIDATINVGNSGGALINTNGELIGINSVKISDADGIGFAVPINIIKPIVNSLTSEGKFDEAWLGIYGYDKEAIKYLDSKIEIETGIYVAQIASDGPLFNSELQEGDIITQIDNTKINKMNDLKKYIYGKKTNDVVVLNVLRNGKEFQKSVKLQGR